MPKSTGRWTGIGIEVRPDTDRTTFKKNINDFLKTFTPSDFTNIKLVGSLDKAATEAQVRADIKAIEKNLSVPINLTGKVSQVVDNATKSKVKATASMSQSVTATTSKGQERLDAYRIAKQELETLKQQERQRRTLNSLISASTVDEKKNLQAMKDYTAEIEVAENKVKELRRARSLTPQFNAIDQEIQGVSLPMANAEIFNEYRSNLISLQKAMTDYDMATAGSIEQEKAGLKIDELNGKLQALSSQYQFTSQQVNNFNDILKAQSSRAGDISKILSGAQSLSSKMAEYFKLNTKFQSNEGYLSWFKDMQERLNELNSEEFIKENGIDAAKEKLAKLNSEFRVFQTDIKAAGLAGKTFGERLQGMFEKFGGWTIVTRTLTAAIRIFKQVVTAVKEVDTAMTELRKVTDETEETYTKFLDNAAKRAQTLGTSLVDTINATADVARLGYNIQEAEGITDSIILFGNVADGLDTIDQASEGIISTLQAFRHEWQDAGMTASEYSELIADKYNEIGNNFAISSGGVSEALLRSSAALASANNTLDESIALAAAANTTIQNPEKVGTALKTVSMYIRAARQEAEEAGIATDGMAKSISSLRASILKLTNQKVDIMLDESTFKSTYQIIKELSQVWDELADVDQAAITKMLGGGVRNGNVINALIQNFGIAEQALEKSANAAGSAMAENEKYLNSIEGKIKILKANFQDFARSLLDSDLFKQIVDTGTNLLSFLNNLASSPAWNLIQNLLVGILDVLNAILNVVNELSSSLLGSTAGLVGVGILVKNFAQLLPGMKTISGAIKEIATVAKTGIRTAGKYVGQFGADVIAAGNAAKAAAAASGESVSAFGAMGAAAASTLAPLLAIAAIAGGIALAVHLSNKEQNKYKNEIKSLNQELQENAEQISDYTNKINDNAKQIQNLSQGNISATDEAVIDRLSTENEYYKEQVELLEKINKEKERQKSIAYADDIINNPTNYLYNEQGQEANWWEKRGTRAEGMGALAATAAMSAEAVFDQALAKNDLETMSNLVQVFLTRMQNLGDYEETWGANQKKVWSDSVTRIFQHQKAIGDTSTAYLMLAHSASISSDEIVNASSREELEKIIENSDALQVLMGALGLKTKDFAAEMWNNRDSIKEAAEALKDYEATAETLNQDIDELQSHISTLNSAQSEFNNTGHISLDTLQQMMSDFPQLIDLIADYVAGNVTAQEVLSKYKDAYEADGNSFANLIQSKISLQNAYANSMKQSLTDWLNDFNSFYETDLKNTQTIEQAKNSVRKKFLSDYYDAWATMSEAQIRVELMKLEMLRESITLANFTAQKVAAAGGNRNFNKAKALQNALPDVSAQQAALQKAMGALNSIDSTFGGGGSAALESYAKSGSGGSSGSSGGSSSGNSAFNAEYDALKHKRDMDLITEKEYLDALERLYKRYFKQGTSDWNKYELEVYKGRKALQEQTEKDILEQQRNAFNAEYELLKHRLDMEVIEEREYYDKLEKLYKKYFAKSSDDWRKYEEEVYKGREKLRQQAASDIKDLLDLVEKYIRQTKQDEIDALEKQIDAYKELADLRKDALDKLKDEAEYTKTVAEKRRQVADLEMRLERAKLDTSASGRKNQLQIEEDLSKARDDLAEYEYDHSVELQKEAIDKELEAETAKAQAKIDILEAYLNNQSQVISDAWTMLNGMSNELYQNLINWNATYGTGVERDVIDKWKAAGDALDYYGSKVQALQTYESLLAKQSADDCEMIADAAVGATGKATGASTSSSKSSASSSVSSSNASVAASNAAAAASKAASEGAAASAKSATAATITGAQSAVNKLFDATKKAVSDAAASAINNIQISYVHSGGGNGGSLAFNMKKLQVKAAGDKYIPRSTDYITQEAGGELIFHKGGVITPLAQGDMVFNNEATRRLWELANNPNSNWIVGGIAKTLGNMLDSAPVRGTKGNAGVTASIVFGDMIVNGNADENVLRQFRDNIVNDVTKSLNDIYFRKGYAAIPRSSF